MSHNNHEKQFKVFGNFSGYLEETACPICSSPADPRFIFRKSKGINILLCPRCDVYYASPKFDEPSLFGINETEAFSDMLVYNNWSYDTWQQSKTRGSFGSNLKVQLVKRYLHDGQAVLDVGCGTGEFVAVARRNELDADGIDNSKMLTDVGKTVLKVPIHQVDNKDFHPPRRFHGIMI